MGGEGRRGEEKGGGGKERAEGEGGWKVGAWTNVHVTPPGLEGNGKLSQALEMVLLVIILQQLRGNSEGEIERESTLK